VAIAGEVDGGALVDAHLMGWRHHQVATAILRSSHVLLGILEREAQAVGLGGLEPGHAQRHGVAVVGKPERQSQQPLTLDLAGLERERLHELAVDPHIQPGTVAQGGRGMVILQLRPDAVLPSR
jgi:hypothetical protein